MSDKPAPCCSCAKPSETICEHCALPVCYGCSYTHPEMGQVCPWCAPPEEETVRIKEEPNGA